MSQILEYIKIALMNIRNNKGRSFLTMLGIIIGITSVIMIISIGNGLHGQVNDELNSLGGGMIYLSLDYNKTDQTMTQDDLDALQEAVPHIRGISPSMTTIGTAIGRKGTFDAYLYMGTEGYLYYSSEDIIRGRYYSRADVESAAPVCVMRKSDAIKLFGTDDVIGKTIEVDLWGMSQDYTIVGIRDDNASTLVNMAMGMDYTLSLEVPYTSVASFGYWTEDFTDVYVFATPEYSTEVAQESITFLENRLQLRGENAVSMQSFSDVTSQFDTILNYITMFIALVAAISLLVGGIGVMNIMLVSVTERTREIGIRKALGARTGSILLQFLAEAGIITLLGGLIGIVLGLLGASVICSALGFTASIDPGVILAATIFSSAVGIFFGIYPARKAAKLSPIEALRHE
ncbi:MAG: ABC transporter permease [Eubacteriales bacterium]|nr:ABC transporter permease [Eubacteriales bacterium]